MLSNPNRLTAMRLTLSLLVPKWQRRSLNLQSLSVEIQESALQVPPGRTDIQQSALQVQEFQRPSVVIQQSALQDPPGRTDIQQSALQAQLVQLFRKQLVMKPVRVLLQPPIFLLVSAGLAGHSAGCPFCLAGLAGHSAGCPRSGFSETASTPQSLPLLGHGIHGPVPLIGTRATPSHGRCPVLSFSRTGSSHLLGFSGLAG